MNLQSELMLTPEVNMDMLKQLREVKSKSNKNKKL